MLHKDAYNIHLIAGPLILQITVAIIFVWQTYVAIFHFVRQKWQSQQKQNAIIQKWKSMS